VTTDPRDQLEQAHVLFQRAYAGHEREFLEDLVAHGQHPLAFYLGCSDSRVIPELLTHAVPGELFVVRNVANLLPPIERRIVSAGAALEYAVGHLHVRHLIVCGHDLCGGVRAALDGGVDAAAYPSLGEWLEGLAPVVERTRSVPEDGGVRWRRTVEENVLEQLTNASIARRSGGRRRPAGAAAGSTTSPRRLRVYHREAEAVSATCSGRPAGARLEQGNQQAGMLADVKITLDLDGDLYRAVKVEAARADRSIRDVVAEALEGWLTAAEVAEDRESATEALAEYRRAGGIPAEDAFALLAAETRARYGEDRAASEVDADR
jgi:carbonic anhydrase